MAEDSSSNSTKKKTIMVWNNQKDDYLCREILLTEPYKFKPRSRERGNTWKTIADALNASSTECCYFKVDARAVRERFNLLISHFKAKERDEINASGISPEQSPLDEVIEHLVQRVEECEEELQNQNKENFDKVQQEKLAAEDVRQKAMETYAETKTRKKLQGESDDDESPKTVKKRRGSGSDTLQYLRERAEMDKELRMQELEVRKKEQELAQQQLLQSQQQNQQMMALMLQLLQQKK